MSGSLAAGLKNWLIDALPDHLGGASPPVALSVIAEALTLDAVTLDPNASAPRPQDQTDDIPWTGVDDTYTLTQPPYPGPVRVRLVLAQGAPVTLRPDEVRFDSANPQQFTLHVRPNHAALTPVAVRVQYGVVAVNTEMRAVQVLGLHLRGEAEAALDAAAALALGALQLNMHDLTEGLAGAHADGLYSVEMRLLRLQLGGITRPAPAERVVQLQAEMVLTASRTLRQDEGTPIQRVVTPGSTPETDQRVVSIEPEVDA